MSIYWIIATQNQNERRQQVGVAEEEEEERKKNERKQAMRQAYGLSEKSRNRLRVNSQYTKQTVKGSTCKQRANESLLRKSTPTKSILPPGANFYAFVSPAKPAKGSTNWLTDGFRQMVCKARK